MNEMKRKQKGMKERVMGMKQNGIGDEREDPDCIWAIGQLGTQVGVWKWEMGGGSCQDACQIVSNDIQWS